MRSNTSIVELPERARQQGAMIKHINAGASTSIRIKTPTVEQRKGRRESSMAYVDEGTFGGFADNDGLMYMEAILSAILSHRSA